ncbi:MAG: endonuclease/exonuclease/phosphatase family protein [Planctomycetota bacterium]|nr:MAG: endonuclease/exonuclease/phosphatase family protein [Planctomycetota bacterium]
MTRWTHALVGVLVASCLLSAQDAQARRARTTRLRAMTFNIRFDFPDDGSNRWNRRADVVAKTIRAAQAHLVGLQEDKAHQVDDLRARLPEYGFVGRGRNASGSGERCSILYDKKRFRLKDSGSFWLSDTPEVPGSNTWGDKYPRVVTWAHLVSKKSKKNLLLLNTHLPEGDRSARLRRKGIEVIARFLQARAKTLRKKRFAVILTGDFNEDAAESSPHDELTGGNELRLTDAWEAAPPSGKRPGTYNGFRGLQTRSRIDWILVGGPVRVFRADKIDQEIDGRWPSDHYPVIADLEIF